MKLFVLLLLLTILLLQGFADALTSINASDSLTTAYEGGERSVALHKNYHPRKINCSYACSRRCRKASRKKMCNRACKTCCMRCHCVPPGTYGNKDVCPCYASLKTHGNRPKCP